MEPKNREVSISKALAYLLRHGAVKEKLPIDYNGYIELDTLLQHNRLKSLKATVPEIEHIVASNDKKRFHLKEDPDTGKLMICAVQGHSLKQIKPSEEVLEPITKTDQLPDHLVHGTNIKNCIQILESGYIKKMNRNHVHLSPGITGKHSEVISGMRYSSTVFIHVKRTQEAVDKLKIFKSLNNVFLSSLDIPLEYIELIQVRPPNVQMSNESNSPKNHQLKLLEELASNNSIKVEYM